MGAQRFRYTLPTTPVAGASVDIGQLSIRIDLVFTGDVEVTGDGEGPVRACALKAVRGLASGVMVRGLGTATPAITTTAGHVFTQVRHEFPESSTVVFAGRCEIDFGHRCDGAEVVVRGRVGYLLRVTVLSAAGGGGASANGRTWFVRHDGELASIGMVVLVAVPIAPTGLVATNEV